MQAIQKQPNRKDVPTLCLREGEPRYLILKKLSSCRGYRAYAPSLFDCFDSLVKPSDRHVHNTCTSLFRHGLLEKVRGMYQLTPAGLAFVGKQ